MNGSGQSGLYEAIYAKEYQTQPMENLQKAQQVIENITGMTGHPVAVKLFSAAQPLEGFEAAPDRRYCQALMEARYGAKRLLSAENISCPAAAAAFGFKPLPEKLASGEMLVGYGIFASTEAGRETVRSMPRLAPGAWAMMALCPLGDAPFEPDVVVIESLPEHLMWLALASVYDVGGRLEFDTAILQATCVDALVVPFSRQKFNASLGCYGCRDATDIEDAETVAGFPFKDMARIVRNLERLGRQTIPRVRGKPVYHAFQKRGGKRE